MKPPVNYPARLLIEPTNDCPRSCHMCPRHYMTDPIGYMKVSQWETLIDEISGNVPCVAIGWRGEPIMHPDFVEMVRYASYYIDRLELVTGAANWTKEQLTTVHLFDLISISLHDPSVEKTVRAIVDAKGNHHSPQIQISVVDSETTVELAKQLAPVVDRVKIKERHTVGGIWGKSNNPLDPPPLSHPCERLYREFAIGWNGRPSRCCIVWQTFPLDAFNLGVAGIWNYPAWIRQRKDGMLDDKCCDCDQYGEYTNGEVIE